MLYRFGDLEVDTDAFEVRAAGRPVEVTDGVAGGVTDGAPDPGAGPHPVPSTRYVVSDGASIAYQCFGEGPNLVLILGFATNLEVQWEHPAIARFLHGLSTSASTTSAS